MNVEGSVRMNSVSGAFELIADTDAVVAEVGSWSSDPEA